MILNEGTLLGSYQILGKLGEGGMGTVYRAVDTMIQREVAIKALRAEIAAQPEILDRFRSEAVLLARLNHPSIAQLYTFFNAGGEFYMVMEYVAGETLESVIQREGALEWQRAFGYVVQILEGLGHAHAAGVLHRDLKPSNIMVTPSGRIKLMDFGIAQALGGARMTRQGRIIGTLEYLAPERIMGKPADTRSDLYSAGVLLFEVLSGRLPFQSDSEYELLQQQVQQAPPQFGSLGVRTPPEVEAVVRKAMEKDPNSRYADTEEFAAAMMALLPNRRTSSRPIVAPALSDSAAGYAPTAMYEAAPELQAAPVAVGAPAPVASQPIVAKPVFWVAIAAACVVIAATILLFTMRSKPGTAVAEVTNSGPAPAQRGQSTLPVNSAPVQIVQPPSGSQTAPEQRAGEQPPSERKPPEQPDRERRPEGGDARTPPPQSPSATEPEGILPLAPSSPAGPATAPSAVPSHPQPRRLVARLSDAHSVYVAGAQGELDYLLRDEIQRQFGLRMKVAASPRDADMIMRISLIEQRRGNGITQAGRIFGVTDRAVIHAVVTDSRSGQVLWQQGAGDRKPIVGAFHGDSLKRLAERLIREFREAYQ